MIPLGLAAENSKDPSAKATTSAEPSLLRTGHPPALPRIVRRDKSRRPIASGVGFPVAADAPFPKALCGSIRWGDGPRR